MTVHAYRPSEVLAACPSAENFLVHFHPSIAFPVSTAPAAAMHWQSIHDSDGTVIYVHRQRERLVIAVLDWL